MYRPFETYQRILWDMYRDSGVQLRYRPFEMKFDEPNAQFLCNVQSCNGFEVRERVTLTGRRLPEVFDEYFLTADTDGNWEQHGTGRIYEILGFFLIEGRWGKKRFATSRSKPQRFTAYCCAVLDLGFEDGDDRRIDTSKSGKVCIYFVDQLAKLP